jgi:hypothetical protein
MTLPSPVNPAIARAAIASFFADSEWQRTIAEYGWKVGMVDDLTVSAVLRARTFNDIEELFTLRLTCTFYPTHPPDAQFVNPETLVYDQDKDRVHLPQLGAPFCHVHPVYSYQHAYPYAPQLVCSSVTLGYYFSNHTPTDDQVWEPGRHSIGSTIRTIHRALHSHDYAGRYPAQ